MEVLQRLKAKTAALEAELVADLDVRETAKKDLAWGSTADWFTHLAGTTRRQGKRTVAHARILTSERSATLDALHAGTVSPDQASVIVDAIEKLPQAAHVRRRGEQVLLEEAGRLNATDLHRAGRHLARVVDPDREERQAEQDLDREDRAAHLGRFFTVTDDGCGGVRIKGRGSVEDGATLRAALLPLTKPEPAVDPDTCEERSSTPNESGPPTPGLNRHKIRSSRQEIGPRVAVTIDADTFSGDRAGTGVTEDGLDLTGSAVRRMACDCALIRVLLDANGCPLDVGRDHRLVTPAIWTALVARDHHCAFPGCTRPPVMGHAHHLRHWIDGGATSLDNLVLLCGHHPPDHPPHPVGSPARHRPETRVPTTTQTREIATPAWTRHRPRHE